MRGRGPGVSCESTLIINIGDITTHPDPHLPSRHRQCQRHHHRYHQVNQNRNTIKPLLIFQIMKCFRWQSMIIDQFKLFSSEYIVDIKSIHNMLLGYYHVALFCHIALHCIVIKLFYNLVSAFWPTWARGAKPTQGGVSMSGAAKILALPELA